MCTREDTVVTTTHTCQELLTLASWDEPLLEKAAIQTSFVNFHYTGFHFPHNGKYSCLNQTIKKQSSLKALSFVCLGIRRIPQIFNMGYKVNSEHRTYIMSGFDVDLMHLLKQKNECFFLFIKMV